MPKYDRLRPRLVLEPRLAVEHLLEAVHAIAAYTAAVVDPRAKEPQRRESRYR